MTQGILLLYNAAYALKAIGRGGVKFCLELHKAWGQTWAATSSVQH